MNNYRPTPLSRSQLSSAKPSQDVLPSPPQSQQQRKPPHQRRRPHPRRRPQRRHETIIMSLVWFDCLHSLGFEHVHMGVLGVGILYRVVIVTLWAFFYCYAFVWSRCLCPGKFTSEYEEMGSGWSEEWKGKDGYGFNIITVLIYQTKEERNWWNDLITNFAYAFLSSLQILSWSSSSQRFGMCLRERRKCAKCCGSFLHDASSSVCFDGKGLFAWVPR